MLTQFDNKIQNQMTALTNFNSEFMIGPCTTKPIRGQHIQYESDSVTVHTYDISYC